MHASKTLPIVAFILVAHLPVALADRIVIRNGSIVRGKAIEDELHPGQYLVFGEIGKTPMVLKRERVVRIEPEPSILDDYTVRRKGLTSMPTAQAQFDLSAWCAEHKLADLAWVHAEAALKIDPDFAPAHLRLGHVRHESKWLTADEAKVAKGLVLYHGKWITTEEKEQRDAEASSTTEHRSWVKRLSILRQLIQLGPDARSREAESQLLAIRDVPAVPAIARVFGTDEDPQLRKLAAEALGKIEGPEAAAALVARLLSEDDPGVRSATMDQLARSKEATIVPRLIVGLRSKSLAVINRAAWALANLNATTAVPKLVPALVTTEEQVVWINQGNGGGIGFNNMAPGSGFGMSGGQSIPVLTGPVVGPGVVAYGATSVPASAFSGSGLSVGGGSRGPIPTIVTVPRQNVEVLAALVKLTGKDFGYDVPTWRRWLSTAYKSETVPAKRVPQP